MSSDIRVLLADYPTAPANLAVDYTSSGFVIEWDQVDNVNVTGYVVEAKLKGSWIRVYDGSNDPSISRINIENKSNFTVG